MRARTIKTSNKKPTGQAVYFRFPANELKQLRAIAQAEERPVSDIVRRAVRDLVAKRMTA